MHAPFLIEKISHTFDAAPCFENFSAQIHAGQRIGIIGQNGSGKSTLLRLISGECAPTEGVIQRPPGCVYAYVPQVLTRTEDNSGGAARIDILRQAFQNTPDILLLDEPSNHLDTHNRHYLHHLLKHFPGTLIIASHDHGLLNSCVNTLWHLVPPDIHIFNGTLDAYDAQWQHQQKAFTAETRRLKRAQKAAHTARMQADQRAQKSKAYGQKKYAGDTLARRAAQAQGNKTQNKLEKHLNRQRTHLSQQQHLHRKAEIIRPTFSIEGQRGMHKMIVTIQNGAVGYAGQPPILTGITLSLMAGERLALVGPNGAGKSTLAKALMAPETRHRTVNWHTPPRIQVGHLDQHYTELEAHETVKRHIEKYRPDWDDAQIRRHLSDFLFRTNACVHRQVQHLSGGEKARLSLCLIAPNTPKLLILDEVTNNLDRETKNHVINVLRDFPGSLIVISHEDDFLERLSITQRFYLPHKNGRTGAAF